jgi:hypothetical protein
MLIVSLLRREAGINRIHLCALCKAADECKICDGRLMDYFYRIIIMLLRKGKRRKKGNKKGEWLRRCLAHLQISRDDFLMYEHFLRKKRIKRIFGYAEKGQMRRI